MRISSNENCLFYYTSLLRDLFSWYVIVFHDGIAAAAGFNLCQLKFRRNREHHRTLFVYIYVYILYLWNMANNDRTVFPNNLIRKRWTFSPSHFPRSDQTLICNNVYDVFVRDYVVNSLESNSLLFLFLNWCFVSPTPLPGSPVWLDHRRVLYKNYYKRTRAHLYTICTWQICETRFDHKENKSLVILVRLLVLYFVLRRQKKIIKVRRASCILSFKRKQYNIMY